MATPTLTANLTTINDCDSSTGLSGDTFVAEPDDKKQGANSQTWAATANGRNAVSVSVATLALGTEHIRLWFKSTISGYYATTTGLQLDVVHGGGTATWNLDPTNSYGGGWLNIVVYGGSTPDSGVAIGGNTVTSILIVQNTTAKPRNSINSWLDYVRYGDGIIATGGTSGDPITLSGIATADKASGFGILEEIQGNKFAFGSLQIGNGATATYFKDVGDVATFADVNVSPTLYKFIYVGSGCDIDIAGGIYNAAGSQTFTIDASDVALASLTMTGKQIARADNSTFESGQVITGNVFDGCLQIDPGLSTFNSNTISNSTDADGALLIDNVLHVVTDIIFQDNVNDVEISVVGTYTANNWNHGGSSFDVNNSSIGLVTINVTGATGDTSSYTNTGGGTTAVVNSKQLTITNLPDGVEVRIRQGSYTISSVQNVTGGQHIYAYNYVGDTKVKITVGGSGWVRQSIDYVISSTDKELLFNLEPDPSYMS
ncbi:MAG: hypothetical protein HRT93_02970 [Piscirickettsiaceae bacterium]|nr:hypothetical protein [Piscirickettsiaceae bacterium]